MASFSIDSEDIDKNNWDNFMQTVNSYNQAGNPVYIRIRTGNLSATFTLSANNFPKPYILTNGNVWWVGFPTPGNSQHSGNQWGFLWNTTTGETKNAVGITFSQSPF